MHLDHVTIRTRDPKRLQTFFEAVFGLETGARPRAIQPIPGFWLYSEGEPIVHIIEAADTGGGYPAEAIDHIGLRLRGYDEFRAKLDRLGIPYSTMDLPELEERRLFLQAPGGVLLEGVFRQPAPVASKDETPVPA